MRSTTTRLLAAVTTPIIALGLTAVAFGGTAQAQTQDGAQSASSRTVDFALKASGYGTRTTGGQVPSGSDQTAFTAIGCAVRTGVEHPHCQRARRILGHDDDRHVRGRP